MTADIEDKSKVDSVFTTLDDMAGYIRRLTRVEATGSLATLRRLDTERPLSPDFHQLLAHCVPDHLFRSKGADDNDPGGRADMMRRFARVAQIMAMAASKKGSEALTKYGLGAALHDNGFSRSRLAMLLSARGATFEDVARRTVRRLVQGSDPLAYSELGRLLLYEGRSEHARAADDIRLRIAADYQSAARKSADQDANAENSD